MTDLLFLLGLLCMAVSVVGLLAYLYRWTRRDEWNTEQWERAREALR